MGPESDPMRSGIVRREGGREDRGSEPRICIPWDGAALLLPPN